MTFEGAVVQTPCETVMDLPLAKMSSPPIAGAVEISGVIVTSVDALLEAKTTPREFSSFTKTAAYFPAAAAGKVNLAFRLIATSAGVQPAGMVERFAATGLSHRNQMKVFEGAGKPSSPALVAVMSEPTWKVPAVVGVALKVGGASIGPIALEVAVARPRPFLFTATLAVTLATTNLPCMFVANVKVLTLLFAALKEVQSTADQVEVGQVKKA